MKTKSSWTRNSALALLSLSSSLFAAAPAYKVDRSFGQEDIKAPPVCISVDVKDQLYVLLNSGSVVTFDATGKATGQFKSEMKPAPTTMTVADGKIYLFNTIQSEKTVEFQGKKIKRMIANGVGCSVFDPVGTKVSELKLSGVNSAADAHFIGKELAIGDLAKSQIVFYSITGTEAKVTRSLTNGFRLCCGIFDFCPGTAPDSVVVANLGAFKVQTFTAGEKLVEFGQRGTKPEEFHGCCNPVNVATLADGSIVTVEKSPTRVKIYDKNGKEPTKVTGLTELVAGCSTIPIAIDSKGALYLASDSKNCIVKCVPGVSDQPEPEEPAEEAMEEVDLPEMSAGMKELIEKVTPLLASKDFAKALTESEAIMKAHPEMSEDEKTQVLLGISISPLIEKGDTEAALKQVDAILSAHPNSALAKQADEVKEGIKAQIEMMKEMQAEEATEPAEETPAKTPVEPAAEPAAPKQP